MLSNVILYGVIGDKIDSYGRYVLSESVDALHSKDKTFKVPVIYWTHSKMSNQLSTMKKGAKVLIRGRLDSNEQFPLYVVCEYIETIL